MKKKNQLILFVVQVKFWKLLSNLWLFFFFEVNDANLRSFVETSLVVTTNSADPEVASHATKIEFKKSEKEAWFYYN